MPNIIDNINSILRETSVYNATLIAVSKTKPIPQLQEAYNAGMRDFGENKVQELSEKAETLPNDIKWHMIGHLQRNKVKYIAPFVHLIHSVDSLRLLETINKEAIKNKRSIKCLLQVHIADEATKFGFDQEEIRDLIKNEKISTFQNIEIIGLMGMATNTDDIDQVKNEFSNLKSFFDQLKALQLPTNIRMEELSMGMSGDYKEAMECGSTMVRVGSSIFGARNYG